ncbi:glycosyl transferase family group 2-domain-containing protein [Lentinula raphanica]|nr:glycosyl transferase family group 2-domain-containing protein [Lentinula raphanica]
MPALTGAYQAQELVCFSTFLRAVEAWTARRGGVVRTPSFPTFLLSSSCLSAFLGSVFLSFFSLDHLVDMSTPNQVHFQPQPRPVHPPHLNSLVDSDSYPNSPSHSLTILNNDYDAFDALLHNIYEKTLQDNWFKPAGDAESSGVCLRVDPTSYRCFPYENPKLIPFEEGVRRLNVEVAVKIRSASVHAAVSRTLPSAREILIDSNTRIQIIPDITALGDAEREQCAAFIRSDHTLVVWAFSVDQVIPLWTELEEKLIKYIWRTRSNPRRDSNTPGFFDPMASPVLHTASLPDLPSNLASTANSASPSTSALPHDSMVRSSIASGPFGMEEVDRSVASSMILNYGFGAMSEADEVEKVVEPPKVPKAKKKNPFWSFLSWWKLQPTTSPTTEKDTSTLEEGSDSRPEPRQLVLLGPFYAGCGAALTMYFAAAGVSNLIEEWVLDGDTRRFGLVVVLPIVAAVSIFFCLQLVGNLSLVLGPVAQYHENSAYYSAQRPKPNVKVDGAARWNESIEEIVIRDDGETKEVEREVKKEVRIGGLPHITIQCPVYKESLELTIAPSILSIKKAMQTYARQGGTSSIFICDDGLQLISEEEKAKRLQFYRNHNIGWVARPRHSSAPGGFKRAGKFKKASNMNYALALSIAMEQQLVKLIADASRPSNSNDSTTSSSEHASRPSTGTSNAPSQPRFDNIDSLEERALQLAVEQIYQESGTVKKVVDESGKETEEVVYHRPWAGGARSLRVGEIILIIDADTVVPEDCFRDAAREMGEEGGEEVAIIQHESDVMQVAHHYFENGITHFTRRINKCISYGCANGEVAPFVGHNAFLRWKAVQDASFIDPADGRRKMWSEANVSEDFDLALRLLLKGYSLRWATYSQGGFKEGVSLTVVDELARWQKYAYGCDEIIFNPLIKWWRHGPISKQLREFMQSAAPVHYKIGMSSYMFSYYGIAAATVGSTLNYLLLGLGPDLDRFYLHSFEILLACVVVFPALGNLGFTMLEYRLGHRSIWSSAVENLRWIPFFLFFFGGLSIHLSTAILAHLFSYDMTWGSTGKEVEKSTFWIEVPRIIKNFKLSIIICLMLIAMMVIFTTDAVPFEWQIPGWNWALIIPLSLVIGCHLLLPIVLNPWLMKFSY